MAKDADVPQQPDALTRLAAAIESLVARQVSMESAGADTSTIERLMQIQGDFAKTIAEANSATLRQIHKPRNEAPPMISAFNPRGDKDFARPLLKCEMHTPWFRPWDQESLTREEIELLNLIEPGVYKLKRTDATTVELKIKGDYALGDSKQLTKLTVVHETAFKNEEFHLLPPLADGLRGMFRGTPIAAKAKAVVTIEEEEAFIAQGLLNSGDVPTDGRLVSVGA